MLLETGRITSIEQEGLWVETIQKSTCGSCAAQKGCGQSLIARVTGHSTYLWIPLQGRDSKDFTVNNQVTIGVPEAIVANGSLLVYCFPLFCLIGMTLVADNLKQTEGVTIAAAIAGLFIGGAIVRVLAYLSRNDSRLQPVLVDGRETVEVVTFVASRL